MFFFSMKHITKKKKFNFLNFKPIISFSFPNAFLAINAKTKKRTIPKNKRIILFSY